MFILLMFFLFKYVDDLIGKGFEWYVIAELMMYASASNVAMALPLAILLSSIMTFGNLGENYELVAIKSGTYEIKEGAPLKETLSLFASGKEFHFSLTFVEGSRFEDWLKQLSSAPYLERLTLEQSETELAQELGIETWDEAQLLAFLAEHGSGA